MSKVAARFARRRAGRPGFTLTEVAVSVAIVAGLTAAVAVGVNAVSSEASDDGERYASSKGSMDEMQQSVADQLRTSGAAPLPTALQQVAIDWYSVDPEGSRTDPPVDSPYPFWRSDAVGTWGGEFGVEQGEALQYTWAGVIEANAPCGYAFNGNDPQAAALYSIMGALILDDDTQWTYKSPTWHSSSDPAVAAGHSYWFRDTQGYSMGVDAVFIDGVELPCTPFYTATADGVTR